MGAALLSRIIPNGAYAVFPTSLFSCGVSRRDVVNAHVNHSRRRRRQRSRFTAAAGIPAGHSSRELHGLSFGRTVSGKPAAFDQERKYKQCSILAEVNEFSKGVVT